MPDPSDSLVTVVGGGAIGAAVAYFLVQAGYRDLQLIEAGEVAAETTSQAAGLVGQSRTTLERTRLTMASAAFYRSIEETLGYTADWRETGSIRIAMSDSAVIELQQIAEVAAKADLHVELVDARRVREELCPVLENVSEVRLALWCPTDGYIQPNSLTNAYLSAARDLGARIVTNTTVEAIEITRGCVTGLRTSRGRLATEIVVNAAGPWAGALSRLAGLEMPIVPVLHEYFVTEPQDGWDSATPCIRIPEIQVYARGEGRGILCGGFEHNGTSLDPLGVDIGAALTARPNWDVLEDFAAGFARFVPPVVETGIQTVFRGWPAFTPDGRFIVGPVSGLRGFVMAAGCNAHGVSGSAGLAQHLLESLSGDVSPYVASLSPDRFIPRTWDWADARVQAQSICENYYPMPAPSR
jgi:glycine/D-amino acid oxidase-like deaminating enzyme